MAKRTIFYRCAKCGYTQPAWLGRCPECGEWNSLEECVAESGVSKSESKAKSSSEKPKPLKMSDIKEMSDGRISTGSEEFDRVLGGGATVRSAILIGGEPGIGKSTLLLQAASFFSRTAKVLYVSGEESASQIKSRSLRLGVNADEIQLLCTTHLEDILEALDSYLPFVVIIDSIQTVYSVEAGFVPGSVTQLNYCCNELVGWAKERDSVLFMTAHVTKDGLLAGPKSLEHIVDTVLSFERTSDDVRFLRAQKNRFGSIDELGLFEMGEKGLSCVSDPSSLFITRRNGETPAGVACASVFEGSRVFIVEIQALTVPAKASVNRVYSEKIEAARVSRVAAVLEKRLDLKFSDQDIYVNVAGGIRLTESAIDAALAAALYSARTDITLPEKTVIVGELSLAGEVRPVTKQKQRLKAARELGFEKLIAPEKEEGALTVESVKELIRSLIQ